MKVRVMVIGTRTKDMMLKNCAKFESCSISSIKLFGCTNAYMQTLTLNFKSKKGHNLSKMKVRVMVLDTHTKNMMLKKCTKFKRCSYST